MNSRFFDMLRRALPVVPLALCVSGQAEAAPSPSLCAPDEQVAFSCPIARSHKIVSLCLAPGKTTPPAARYVFGTPSHPELIYPAEGRARANFRTSRLSYAAGTGGNAYSFIKDGTQYILFYLSGAGLQRAGVIVKPVNQIDASAELDCRPNTVLHAFDDDLWDITRSWGPDPELDGNVLPVTKDINIPL
ncbi:hypothetical protein [Bombella apis]|uniref:hypothetical protein n=1 Tax=Bombella apis TaxID=1785988 RepID=UPI0012B8D3F1|nr:hypothetical protein [Bombella apis]MPW00398.1 hypothetical protein [Bombella apis]